MIMISTPWDWEYNGTEYSLLFILGYPVIWARVQLFLFESEALTAKKCHVSSLKFDFTLTTSYLWCDHFNHMKKLTAWCFFTVFRCVFQMKWRIRQVSNSYWRSEWHPTCLLAITPFWADTAGCCQPNDPVLLIHRLASLNCTWWLLLNAQTATDALHRSDDRITCNSVISYLVPFFSDDYTSYFASSTMLTLLPELCCFGARRNFVPNKEK